MGTMTRLDMVKAFFTCRENKKTVNIAISNNKNGRHALIESIMQSKHHKIKEWLIEKRGRIAQSYVRKFVKFWLQQIYNKINNNNNGIVMHSKQ